MHSPYSSPITHIQSTSVICDRFIQPFRGLVCFHFFEVETQLDNFFCSLCQHHCITGTWYEMSLQFNSFVFHLNHGKAVICGVVLIYMQV